MSEYHQISVNFQDVDCLVDALKELGYKPVVTKEAKNLYGYMGDARKERAHIVIPRSQIGTASNDIGFFKKADKSIEMIVSAYDEAGWNQKVSKLKQIYSKNVILKHAKKAKHRVKSQEMQADGSIKIKVKVR